jgi:hypothetical protein
VKIDIPCEHVYTNPLLGEESRGLTFFIWELADKRIIEERAMDRVVQSTWRTSDYRITPRNM